MEMEKQKVLKDWLWRIGVVTIMALLFVIAIITAGCSQGATNITGPSSTTGTTTGIVDYNDPAIQLVKQYNNNPTVRWDKSIVTVYDSIGEVVQADLDEWSSYMNGIKLVKVASAPADIEILEQQGLCQGETKVNYIYYVAQKATITMTKIDVGCDGRRLIKHELGHAVGINPHTSDGGVMDLYRPSMAITSTVATVLNKLYSLPPGTKVG